ISASVRRLMRCDLVSVALPDSTNTYLRRYVVDFPQSKGFIREETQVLIDGSIGGWVFRNGKLWTGNAAAATQLSLDKDPALAEGFQSGCVLPLVSRDRVLGVVALARLEEIEFTPDEVDLAMQVAN